MVVLVVMQDNEVQKVGISRNKIGTCCTGLLLVHVHIESEESAVTLTISDVYRGGPIVIPKI